jgi:hypothetical protein
MRLSTLLTAAGLCLGLASAALAGPKVAEIRITIGPDLAKQDDAIGPPEAERLTADLRRALERRLPADADGGTLDLVIEDARPNRPTLTKMSKTPGLSYESFGTGGARISGEYVDAAGARTPIGYSWYETDITHASYAETWRDADKAFDRLSQRLSEGKLTPRP